MSYGIDEFARDQQGWSFVAVRAPIERVAEAIASRAGVLRHERDIRPEPMEEDAGIQGEQGDEPQARLLVANPSAVERADYFLLAVPEVLRSDVPHVFEKLGMMAEAVGAAGEEGEDDEGDFPQDESEFRSRMVEGIWKRADAVRRAGGSSKPD